jgi:hypothetical protein
MTRMLAFVAALLLTAITVSSACIANPSEPFQFTIEPARAAGVVQVRFQRSENNNNHSWSSSFRASELTGLGLADLNDPGTRPIQFAVVREAGRIDCAGTGGNRMARGTCSLTPDARFNDFLAARGIKRPTAEETFTLMALDVRADLVGAISAANYPTPTIDKLVELTAVGVTPDYIRGLSAQGYRPDSLQELVEFGALKITPEYIGSFARAGYGNLKANELVQLKALGISADYVAGFERLGYGRLPVGTLVQLKALDITPEYVRAVQQGDTLPSPDHLVQLRAVSRDFRRH